MSFILEALKKLEQKRRHGSVPDLMTVHAPDQKETGKRLPWIYLIFGALILNAGIITAVFHPWESDKPSVMSQSSVSDESQLAKAELDQEKTVSGEAVPSSSLSPESEINQSSGGINRSSKAGPGANAVLTDEGTAPNVSPNVSPDVSPDVQVKNSQEKAGEEMQDNTVPDAQQVQDPVASLNMNLSPQELENLRTTIKEEQSLTGNTEPSIKRFSEDTERESHDSVLELSQLSSEIKDEIPDISISGHIYSNNPESRLANINGSILREGENVTKGLKVDEITVSGVVFSYQGVRFRVSAF